MTSVEASLIKRTFQDIPEDKALDIEQAAMMRDLGYRAGSTWPDLLKSQRVLIVSEAGAGKTHECRETQQAMWKAGEPAFYLELARLTQSNVRDMLTAEEEGRFDAWVTSQSEVATFFLDSVDELKLTHGSFEEALKRLAKTVAGQLGRVRVVVTSRPIPIDQKLMRDILPVPAPPEIEATSQEFADIAMGRKDNTDRAEAEIATWRNVALMPLSDDQMKEMAAAEGVSDPDALLGEIQRRNAQEFARRPQDLIELCADWRASKRIRTHREQVASNITVKLSPRQAPRREVTSLSLAKATDGASRLALAALLTRKLTIRHSAEADRGGDADDVPLDPAAILPDWTDDERRTLLERPLFGFASYGRVRFHHRSIIENLAAQRIAELREQGMPAKAVKRLLFTSTADGNVVRPSMAPTAAWLALSDPAIFKDVLEREPSVLLNHGDPESLSPAQRQEVLAAYVKRYGDGGWRGMSVPGIQVRRFAGADLGPKIVVLWNAGVENEEVRELLMELAKAGRNVEFADTAHAVAISPDVLMNERLDGLEVLIALNDARLDALTASIADDPAKWPPRLSIWAVVRLFPKHLSVERLCKVLARTTEKKRAVGDLSYALPRLIHRAELSDAILEELRERLTALIDESLAWNKDKWPHLTTARHHLVPALAATCHILLDRGCRGGDLLRSAVMSIRLTDREYSSSDEKKSLRERFFKSDGDFRKAAFLADDAFLQSVKAQPDAFKRFARVSFHDGIIVPQEDRDAGWLIDLLRDQTQPSDLRAMLLQAAIRMRSATPWVEHLALLKPHVADLPDLVAVLDELAKPRKRDEEVERWEKEDAKRQKKYERRDAKAHHSWVAFWQEIASNPDAVFADDRSSITAWNLWRAMERTGDDSQASGWNRRFVERHFGKEVADRIRLAFMKFWRRDTPTLRSERPAGERNSYWTRWQLGLAAISAEAEDPTWATKLSPDEVRRALRFAPLQLNGFPSWLDGFAAIHPDAVDEVLGNELSAELAEPPTDYSSLLQNLRSAAPALAKPFVSRLKTWLTGKSWRSGNIKNQAAQRERLNQVLSILLRQDDAALATSVRDMAAAELAARPNGPLTPVWLPTLMRLDPEAGVDALERLLAPLQPAKLGPAVGWFSILFGDRSGGDGVPLSAPGFTPQLLLRLTRLAYHHVSVAHDHERREGTYTPDQRDDAERARNHVLSALMSAEGLEGWTARLAMVDDPLFAHFRDRIRTISRQRAAEEADATVFTENNVAALDKYRDLAPTTRNDMFALMIDRLDDLDDALTQDASPRAALALIQDETIMRQQIARELSFGSRGCYNVNQEAVTADGKETDVRLCSTASDQEGVIELKIGEKDRSGADLRSALKAQLVTKYMCPESRRAGCFMITVNSDRTWQHPDTGKKLDLAGLVAMLSEEAARIEEQMGGSVKLVVRGLDLRPRLPTEVALEKAARAG